MSSPSGRSTGPGSISLWRATTPGDDPVKLREMLTPWRDAGATWWLEANWSAMADLTPVLARVRQGPPGI